MALAVWMSPRRGRQRAAPVLSPPAGAIPSVSQKPTGLRPWLHANAPMRGLNGKIATEQTAMQPPLQGGVAPPQGAASIADPYLGFVRLRRTAPQATSARCYAAEKPHIGATWPPGIGVDKVASVTSCSSWNGKARQGPGARETALLRNEPKGMITRVSAVRWDERQRLPQPGAAVPHRLPQPGATVLHRLPLCYTGGGDGNGGEADRRTVVTAGRWATGRRAR